MIQQMAPRSASEKVRSKKSYFSSACEYLKLPISFNIVVCQKNANNQCDKNETNPCFLGLDNKVV
jgi:hypothetical protein